jgi:DNA repair ATPase RecN
MFKKSQIMSKSCQKVVKKLSKSRQKVVKQLSKSCHKKIFEKGWKMEEAEEKIKGRK